MKDQADGKYLCFESIDVTFMMLSKLDLQMDSIHPLNCSQFLLVTLLFK